jgi:type II secretory pathway pseudopilin PulG
VVIFVFGVLAALLLPAIQSSRSTAHRDSCGNNLRQMGLAFAAHHCAISAFPTGERDWWTRPRFGVDFAECSLYSISCLVHNDLFRNLGDGADGNSFKVNNL